MSDSNGPVRRRRIAGESKPAAPAKKAVAKKVATGKKAAAKKSTSAAAVAPTSKPPVAKKAPVKKSQTGAPAAKKAPATKAASAASAKVPTKVPTAKKAAVSAPASPVALTKVPTVSRPVRAAAPAPSASTTGAGSSGTSGGPTRRDLFWLVPVSLLAVGSLVAGVLFLVTGINDKGGDSKDGLDTSRRQASSAAASAAETIFSFRFDQLPEHLKASKALMTPAFAKEFDKIAPALTELAPQRKIQVEAVARDSAALPCGDECSTTKANVLVFVDQARLVGGSKEPTVFANRISVSMVKRDGGWLVANIRAL